MAQGVDVVFSAAGSTGFGIMQAAMDVVVPYIHDCFLLTRPQDLNRRAALYMAPAFRRAVETPGPEIPGAPAREQDDDEHRDGLEQIGRRLTVGADHARRPDEHDQDLAGGVRRGGDRVGGEDGEADDFRDPLMVGLVAGDGLADEDAFQAAAAGPRFVTHALVAFLT